MKNFDQILKEGKDKAKSSGPQDQAKKWREYINLLMETLHAINGMYGTTNEHQIKIKSSKCNSCGVASFIIAVRDISDRSKITKFHRWRWMAVSDGTYYCEKCKKGR